MHMGGKVSFRQKRREAPQWLFRWDGSGEPWWANLVAVAVVGLCFSVAFGMLQIRLGSPKMQLDVPQRGGWLQEVAGRDLAIQWSRIAEQDGPFPGRWVSAGSGAVEDQALRMISEGQVGTGRYEPRLRDSWVAGPEAGRKLAEGGNMVLPKPADPEPIAWQGNALPRVGLRPVIRPLVHGDAAILFQPEWRAEVDRKFQGVEIRFLLRVGSAGEVEDVVLMSGGVDGVNQPTLQALRQWLRACRLEWSGKDRWVAVGVGFEVQPAP